MAGKTVEELVNMLNQSDESFGIGVHGIGGNISLADKKQIAERILESGINMQNGWQSILATTVSLGDRFNEELTENLLNYNYTPGTAQCNVIIVSPKVISNSNGEKIFLGYPFKNLRTASQQYTPTCVLDQICKNLGKIPQEFLYGYFDESSHTIVENPNYFSNLPIDKQDELFSQIEASMSEISKMVSDCVIEGDDVGLIRSMFSQIQRTGRFDDENFKKNLMENNALAYLDEVKRVKEKNTDVTRNDKVSEEDKDLNSKINSCVEAIPIRQNLFGRAIDVEKIGSKKDILTEAYKSFSLEDIKYVTNENINGLENALKLMQKIPKEYLPDRLLEEDINHRLAGVSRNGRQVLTKDYLDEKKNIEEEFDMCVASYLISGGDDFYSRFRQTISNMSRAGMNINVGKSVVKIGETMAIRMEGLQNSAERNSQAWKFLLEPTLKAYTMSKIIGNEKWNPMQHKAFEEKLVELGLVELDKDKESFEVPKKGRKILAREDKKLPEKGSSMQGYVFEEDARRQAILQYINTGMTPLGFKISEDGDLVRETQIEEMKRKAQMQQNERAQRAKYEVKKEKERDASRARMGIER